MKKKKENRVQVRYRMHVFYYACALVQKYQNCSSPSIISLCLSVDCRLFRAFCAFASSYLLGSLCIRPLLFISYAVFFCFQYPFRSVSISFFFAPPFLSCFKIPFCRFFFPLRSFSSSHRTQTLCHSSFCLNQNE